MMLRLEIGNSKLALEGENNRFRFSSFLFRPLLMTLRMIKFEHGPAHARRTVSLKLDHPLRLECVDGVHQPKQARGHQVIGIDLVRKFGADSIRVEFDDGHVHQHEFVA